VSDPGQHHGALDDVGELADVAGPVVRHEPFHRLPRDAVDALAHLAGEPGDEELAGRACARP
jgi:hypothetical protein